MTDRVLELEDGKITLSKELLESCIHCGLCLPACPTYLATGREMESPRGRIFLLAQAQEQNHLDDRAREHIESCLGCLGCQTACPSGVHYEGILDQARPTLARARSSLTRFVMRFSFERLLPDYKLLRGLGGLMRWAQKWSLDSLALNLASKLPGLAYLAGWKQFTPAVPAHKMLPSKSWKPGPKQGRALFFIGCVMDIFYNHVNHAALRLMVKQGELVEIPEQTCCGALAFHAGEVDIARNLARRNVDLFAGSSDPIVVTSAGCGAMLKHYGELLDDESARAFSARVEDISERLYKTSQEGKLNCFNSCDPTSVSESGKNRKIVYHAACHLAHAQGVRKEPQALLSSLAADCGAHLYDLNEAEQCCGSAGIYNLMNTPMSLKVLERKMKFIEDSGANLVVTGNPGCLLQLEAGARLHRLNVKVKHLAEVLDEL
jgi:glycolate oxidase iron-sulfur subunit